MFDYEIRYLKLDGALAMQFQVNCLDNKQAWRVALELFGDEFAGFEIWQGQSCIEKGNHLAGRAQGT